MKSQKEILELVAAARAVVQSYVGSEHSFLRTRIPMVISMIDDIEATVLSTTWPPVAGAFSDVSIGLYAVRELDEVDDGRLSLPLCRLDNALKDR